MTMSNLSLYTVTALLILDAEGQRVLAKYYDPPHQTAPGTGIPAELGVGAGGPGMGGLTTLKEQKAFEKSVFEKIRRGGGGFVSSYRYASILLQTSRSLLFVFCVAHLALYLQSTPQLDIYMRRPNTNASFADASPLIRLSGEIHPLPPHIILTRTVVDLHFIIVGPLSTSNEIMLNQTLGAFHDAVHLLLRGQIEKRNVLEGLDLVLLAADETVDDG
ncbi:coatomer zeta subunit [Kwoniella heveanensis CBS 569]|nr:coatomer zeta subunit [Kwoniella heveanensis CBS 569]